MTNLSDAYENLGYIPQNLVDPVNNSYATRVTPEYVIELLAGRQYNLARRATLEAARDGRVHEHRDEARRTTVLTIDGVEIGQSSVLTAAWDYSDRSLIIDDDDHGRAWRGFNDGSQRGL